ncbi:hypothetical protein [Desulfitobacterium sp.]|uniref:hypothetical protein n=1 Tax=Desulfitobacterium sp. TaxID=49981 RepID=UPI002B1F0836|nr:hypothetical protein [Desulfitobacterium sp.]MEA4900329.1 hypothetical protein [Desulfitobacterium sp.]
MNVNAKDLIKEYVEGIQDSEAEKLLRYIQENFEVVKTKEDEEVFERGRKEVESGEYRIL